MATKRPCQSMPSTASAAKKPRAGAGHWSMGLLAAMEDPKQVVESDELCVTIKDAFPKARHHFLVLPREKISNLKSLTSSHLDLLKHVYDRGRAQAAKITTTEPGVQFRYGYHAVPSMARLHMHVISQDFDSPCLKHKKHWNSFTTDFFMDADRIVKMLREEGKIVIDVDHYNSQLKKELQCHHCHRTLTNMPKLKDHISHCSSQSPSP